MYPDGRATSVGIPPWRSGAFYLGQQEHASANCAKVVGKQERADDASLHRFASNDGFAHPERFT